MEEYRCGLWKKEAKSGIKYCSGKIKIGDREFYVTLFNNDKKGNEKAPDFNIIMRNSVVIKEMGEQIKYENKSSKENYDQIYADFGNNLEISDEEIAF